VSARGTQPSLVEGETALETYDRLNMSTNVTIAAIVEHYRQLIADPDEKVTDAQVEAALDAWFENTLERTPQWLRDSVKDSHASRMRAALEAGARA
jgi:hypothetical protein